MEIPRSVQEEIPFSVTWSNILEKIKEKSNAHVYSGWFESLELVHQEANTIILAAKSNFDKNWVENHYIDFISETINEIYNRKFEIKVVSSSKDQNTAKSPGKIKPALTIGRKTEFIARQTELLGNLNPSYTFENFVVGPSNRFAHAASHAVAHKTGTTYNPLFIYGGVGLGKTHLLNAIGNHIKKSKQNVCSVSAEEFTNQVIRGIKTNKMEEFHNRYRFGCDILLIDDIQFIAGKESTQEVFFHTFNALYESKKHIVLTSDKPPSEMLKLEDRLSSRFEWGLTADIQPPEFETRMAILTQKEESEGIEIPIEAKMFLAQHSESNVRKLEGLFNNLVAQSRLTNKEIDIDMAKGTVGKIAKERVVTVEAILREVASYFGLRVLDLKSSKKQKNISIPRQIAMYLSRKYTVSSFPEIGEKFGGKDHSTIIHGFNKIERLLGNDLALTKSVNAISKRIDNMNT